MSKHDPVIIACVIKTGSFFNIINYPMKKTSLFLAIAFSAVTAGAQNNVILLDLTKSTTPLEFDTENGSWNDTYNDNAMSIDSQVFSFVHNSMSEWKTWWGFTASAHADNSRPENNLERQWSNMAKGGIMLGEDGKIKTDSYGAPVVSPQVPYLVAFYSPYMSARPVSMSFADGKSYKANGIYVNLNSYAYYSVECGDGFSRAFTNGDKFTLTIHGVAPNESEKTVNVSLAEFSNGDITINRGWKFVDLSSLGTVSELYFTMESTDSGIYGMNTPAYFCIDKLMVEPADQSAVATIRAEKTADIRYNRSAGLISLVNADFAIVYDMAGNKVKAVEATEFSISDLPAGIYLVKAGSAALKIAR